MSSLNDADDFAELDRRVMVLALYVLKLKIPAFRNFENWAGV